MFYYLNILLYMDIFVLMKFLWSMVCQEQLRSFYYTKYKKVLKHYLGHQSVLNYLNFLIKINMTVYQGNTVAKVSCIFWLWDGDRWLPEEKDHYCVSYNEKVALGTKLTTALLVLRLRATESVYTLYSFPNPFFRTLSRATVVTSMWIELFFWALNVL